MKEVLFRLLAAVGALALVIGVDILFRPDFYGIGAQPTSTPPTASPANATDPAQRPEVPAGAGLPAAGTAPGAIDADTLARWVEELAAALHRRAERTTTAGEDSAVCERIVQRFAAAAERDRQAVGRPLALLARGSGEARIRWAAVRALGATGGDEAGAALAERVTDADPCVRTAAVVALGTCPEPEYGGILIEALGRVTDAGLRERIADALATRSDARAVEPLREALRNERSGSTRARLLAALAEIGGAEAEAELAARLTSDDAEEVRIRAVRGLAVRRSALACDLLGTALEKDTRSAVRAEAVRALVLLCGVEARDRLMQALVRDSAAEVRDAAALALRELR